MKTKLLYFFVALLLLTSCLVTEGEDEEEAVPGDTCYLKNKVTTLKTESGFTFVQDFKYSYNSQNQLIAITSSDTAAINISLTYDTENRLIGEQNTARVKWENEYNEQNQLVKQIKQYKRVDSPTEYYYFIHRYNSANELTDSRYYFVGEETEQLVYSYNYTYANGEVSRVEVMLGNEKLSDVTITYDDKHTPYKELPLVTLPAYGSLEMPMQGLLKHNIKSINVIGSNGTVYSSSSYEATYTYTAAGYPKEVVKTYADKTQEFTTFNYTCE